MVMAALSLPLLLGCGCCDIDWPFSGSPAFTADQVVGVWTSECGGKVSIAEGGTFRADALVVHDEDADERRTPVSGSGTWTLKPADNNHNPYAELTLEGRRGTIELDAWPGDEFKDLRIEVGGLDEPVRCRLTR
ncbi:hypothetical protein GCM10010532_003590 [Dactylosporangium siamense]